MKTVGSVAMVFGAVFWLIFSQGGPFNIGAKQALAITGAIALVVAIGAGVAWLKKQGGKKA